MNTAGSVAYGWGVLLLAGAGSFYYAKKEIDGRRRDQSRAGTRPTEQLDWEQKIARMEAESAKSKPSAGNAEPDPAPGRTADLSTTTPGQKADPAMHSAPTGVDTPKASANSQQER